MTQLYEGMFLLDNREVKKGLEQSRDRLTALLKKHGAEPRLVRKWDERKLCFDIKKQKRATYMIAYFDATGGAIDKITHEAHLSEYILRFALFRAESIPAKMTEEPWDASIAPQIEEIGVLREPVMDPLADIGPIPAEIAEEVV